MSGPEQSPLFSKTLRIESKTIFVDVKENSNGTYLKIAERSTRGDRSTVVMAVSGIQELRDALDEALAIQNAQVKPQPEFLSRRKNPLTSQKERMSQDIFSVHFICTGNYCNIMPFNISAIRGEIPRSMTVAFSMDS